MAICNRFHHETNTNNKLLLWRYGSNQIENATKLGPSKKNVFGGLFIHGSVIATNALQLSYSANKITAFHYRKGITFTSLNGVRTD